MQLQTGRIMASDKNSKFLEAVKRKIKHLLESLQEIESNNLPPI